MMIIIFPQTKYWDVGCEEAKTGRYVSNIYIISTENMRYSWLSNYTLLPFLSHSMIPSHDPPPQSKSPSHSSPKKLHKSCFGNFSLFRKVDMFAERETLNKKFYFKPCTLLTISVRLSNLFDYYTFCLILYNFLLVLILNPYVCCINLIRRNPQSLILE